MPIFALSLQPRAHTGADIAITRQFYLLCIVKQSCHCTEVNQHICPLARDMPCERSALVSVCDKKEVVFQERFRLMNDLLRLEIKGCRTFMETYIPNILSKAM